MKSVFVSVIGQDDNIGDSALRRGLIAGLRHPRIQLHVFVGANSDGYIAGLGLRADDILYRDKTQWLESLSLNRGRGQSSFVSNAGEVTTMTGPKYLGRAQLVALGRLKLNGGALIQTGVGVRNPYTPSRIAQWSALRAFDLVTWRDRISRDFAGVGSVEPDWGFASSDDDASSSNGKDRGRMVISLRGDRDWPGPSWFAAVKAVISALEVEPVVLAQVERDAARAVQIQQEFGSGVEVVQWAAADHHEQETLARSLYRESSVVVSDRLHALILGATEGAYPLGLPPGDPRKLVRTLAPANFERFSTDIVSFDAATLPSRDVLAAEVKALTGDASRRLETLASRVVELVLSR